MYNCNRCKINLENNISYGNDDGRGSNFVCSYCYAIINIQKALKDIEFGETTIAKTYLKEAINAIKVQNPRR